MATSAAWTNASFVGFEALGGAGEDSGGRTPLSGSSVRGLVRVRTSPSVAASRSRFVKGSVPQRSEIVASTDVWSIGPEPRNTVPATIRGETNTAGTRTPKRVKSNPYSPTVPSPGGVAFAGGAT